MIIAIDGPAASGKGTLGKRLAAQYGLRHLDTGLIYRALGFPTRMFTVLFALGRLPGWIAHWREMHDEGDSKIGRPRQIYTGYTERDYTTIDAR